MVPSSVKKVFDTFPLKVHPAVDNSTAKSLKELEARKYPFGGSQTDSNFNLGVFNVFEHDGNYLPTDPISLAQATILCHKNNLSLPEVTSTSTSKNCLITLSYSASPDNRLPILIEEPSRTIRLCEEILSTTNDKLNVTDKILNEYIDDIILDSWLMCVFLENVDIVRIFNIPYITKIDLFKHLGTWKGFATRYALNEDIYHRKLQELKTVFELYHTADAIAKIKIDSYKLHINSLLEGTKLHALLSL
ncbi:hypothetical protein CLIB1444_03S07558 [[Candida] jaroonii]|uniref:Uncharacterized protein n=1 Tax=[Candida] jaroonii TaxID=467808 RepID=A0ACA9Y639_9ASCO|nr:hypothetical protein CLIB1444_03S07558 [[Candida] jaroonii]